MSHDKLWSQMLGVKRPPKEVVKFFEEKMIQDIEFSSEYVTETFNTIVIKYRGVPVAGLLPQTRYQELTPWGNFKRYCSQEFWEKLAEKLVVSYKSQVRNQSAGTKLITETGMSILEDFCLSNESKSNRSSADYTELMVVKDLMVKHGLSFPYEQDLEEATSKMLSLADGQVRKQVQERNIPLLVQGCNQIIEQELKSDQIKEVIWAGRDFSGTEDLIVRGQSIIVKISLKSIKNGGSGTLKNVGGSSFKEIGIDFSVECEQIKKDVCERLILEQPGLGVSMNTPQSKIKLLAKNNEEVRVLADQASMGSLRKINEKIYQGLSSLEERRLVEFVNHKILGNNENGLWVCLVNEDGLKTWRQEEAYFVGESDKLTLGSLIDKGFKIYKNGKPFLRANTCCTNGKGLSPVCQRYFYDYSEGPVTPSP